MNQVAERIVILGGAKRLVGIVSESADGRTGDQPAVLILNMGVIHRVGNNRLSVTMARQLARWGHLVVRFDLAGVGDSPSSTESIEPVVAALTDIRDVVDWAIAQGAASIILMGLCAGADRSIFYAGQDPRIAGVALIDPSMPPTKRYILVELKRRTMQLISKAGLRGLPSWFWRKATRTLARIGEPKELWLPVDFNQKNVRAFYEASYRSAVAAGTQIFILFTSAYHHRYNTRKQTIEALPNIRFGKHLRLESATAADHTFMLECHRDLLLDLINDWLVTTDFRKPAHNLTATEALLPVDTVRAGEERLRE